jgi:hypothetical protein
MLEIFSLNQLGYFVSWLASCVSFAAICRAVRQVGAGVIPSSKDSFAAVRARLGPLFRLSLSLYFLLLALCTVALILGMGLLWMLGRRHGHPSQLGIMLASFTAVGLVSLVLSRFGLAVPALVLDNYGVAKALFRSDELTEGTWLILAALLAKSLIGGYLVGMFPFWLASRIPAGAVLPSWFPWLLDAVSVASVIVFEPVMFIGFALLYLRKSAPSPPSDGVFSL